MNWKKFFSELKRRNVYKVTVAYAVVAWLLIQITTQVFRFSKFRITVRLVVLAIACPDYRRGCPTMHIA